MRAWSAELMYQVMEQLTLQNHENSGSDERYRERDEAHATTVRRDSLAAPIPGASTS